MEKPSFFWFKSSDLILKRKKNKRRNLGRYSPAPHPFGIVTVPSTSSSCQHGLLVDVVVMHRRPCPSVPSSASQTSSSPTTCCQLCFGPSNSFNLTELDLWLLSISLSGSTRICTCLELLKLSLLNGSSLKLLSVVDQPIEALKKCIFLL